MQALAAVGSQVRLVGRLVMPRLVRAARLHRRDDMDQAGVIAAPFQHLGNDRFLADMTLGNVLDLDARCRRQPGRCFAHTLTQLHGKSRIVEDAHAPGADKPRHSIGVAHRRKRARHHNPIVARQNSCDPITVALRQRPAHRNLDRFPMLPGYYFLLGSGSAGLGQADIPAVPLRCNANLASILLAMPLLSAPSPTCAHPAQLLPLTPNGRKQWVRIAGQLIRSKVVERKNRRDRGYPRRGSAA